VVVVLWHVVGILALFSSPGGHSYWLGLGVLAYTFGLRHAFDVDHIAAIDNTVRKLMQQGVASTGVGFYFSLGHSTVVFILSILTAFAAKWIQHTTPQLQVFGGIVGTTVSGVFLVLIGGINLALLVKLLRLFGELRHQPAGDPDQLESLLQSRGFFNRLLRSATKLVGKSWHIYPVGFLFGLGFDTASEVALLAISAEAVRTTASVTGILSLPILFAAGMSLMDTADGVFMTHAYHWAFTNPIRKLYYNVSITGIAVTAALLIGLIELGQVFSSHVQLHGVFWTWLQSVQFGDLGYALAALFAGAWIVSYGVWKVFRIEERWRAAPDYEHESS